jgi:hypothetical protein
MHTYASPRRGYCASCDSSLTDTPVYRMDEAYCCLGCAQNGPCICTYESDLADDGVDHIGMPFPIGDVAPVTTPVAAAVAAAPERVREMSIR